MDLCSEQRLNASGRYLDALGVASLKNKVVIQQTACLWGQSPSFPQGETHIISMGKPCFSRRFAFAKHKPF